MGGGASMHKNKDPDSSDSSSTSRDRELQRERETATAKQKQSKSGFRILRKRNKKAEHSSSMGKLERALKAAILIQRWYRQYLARMEIRRRYTWNIFQTIEYSGEQDQMKLYNFFNALLTHIPQQKEGTNGARDKDAETRTSPDSMSLSSGGVGGESTAGSSQMTSTSGLKLRKRKVFSGGNGPGVDLEDIPVESDYKGVHIRFPMTLQNLQELIDGFKRKKILHVRYVAGILRVATHSLRQRPNFNQPSTALSKQITVCGDLHGKLDDLLVIFYKNGLPSPENPYIFNGDYVDRGKRSIEILLTLLSCFLLSPNSVYLNRGNHEDHIMNMRYGFIREVRLKYKVFATGLLHLVDQVYRSLPFGSIVDNRVLVVHGGISESTDLRLLEQVDRHKYVSILRPPIVETMDDEGRVTNLSELYSSGHSCSEWRQVLDIMWSDPTSGNGCSPNTFRGGGTYFGADVTEKVLRRHGLQLLIRSHECKPDGYEFMHNNKCLTVFSASNYYEEGSNKGAYVKLIGGPTEPLEPYFVQFNAATPKLRNMTIRQRVGLVEASALRELQSRIKLFQEQLLQEFLEFDTWERGVVSLNDWCTAMEKGSELKLPWRLLRSRLADCDPHGNVMYHTTFQEDSASAQKDTDDVTVAEVLYRNKSSLEAIFRIIDKDNSGYISMSEFSDACELLGTYLSSPIEALKETFYSLDMNKDGRIDLNEFLETFRIVSTGQECLDAEEFEEE